MGTWAWSARNTSYLSMGQPDFWKRGPKFKPAARPNSEEVTMTIWQMPSEDKLLLTKRKHYGHGGNDIKLKDPRPPGKHHKNELKHQGLTWNNH